MFQKEKKKKDFRSLIILAVRQNGKGEKGHFKEGDWPTQDWMQTLVTYVHI